MRVFTAESMRELDRRAIAGVDAPAVPPAELMENAGAAVARFLRDHYAAALRHPVVVLAGKGNNGGDGCVVARLLAAAGAEVSLVLLARPEELAGEAAAALRRFSDAAAGRRAQVLVAAGEEAWPRERGRLAGSALIVDAIFGTGLRSTPRGWIAGAIRDVNSLPSAIPRVAVDLASGLPADGELDGDFSNWDWSAVLRATASVSFSAPKLGQVSGPGVAATGLLRVAPIGIPAATLAAVPTPFAFATAELCREFVAPRPADSHKGLYGHVLVLGGSAGKSGAAAMASEAALRVGAGLVTAAVPRSVQAAVAAYRPELMTEGLAETADGSLGAALLGDECRRYLLAGKTVLALGPGLGRNAETAEVARQIILRSPVPWVLDADGLNAFAGRPAVLKADPKGGAPTAAHGVLTPHPGEAARLLGVTGAAIQARRLTHARALAAASGAVVVLKGFRSITVAPDGRACFNPTGNPGMATGGSGDILTGVVGGLLGQFPRADPLAVVAAAVYIHGLAGDLAAEETGEMSLLATDITAHLPAALRRIAAAPTPPAECSVEFGDRGPERLVPAR